jgi:chaperone BCS1
MTLASISAILSSPFVAGTLMVLASGALAGHAVKVPTKMFGWLKRRILFTVEIDNQDQAFPWMKMWMAKRTKARYLAINATFPGDNIIGDGRRKPIFNLCPLGLSTFRHNGKRVIAWLYKSEAQGTCAWRETISLQCLRGSKEFVESILLEAYELHLGLDRDSIEVWLPDGNGWQLADRKSARPLSSLVLPDGVGDGVIEDAKRFLQSKQWYLDCGIPWRRGYLLSGPPGNGKSSLVHALASELRTNINVVSLSAFESDRQLTDCLIRVPKGNIVLLEDVDAAWNGREAAAGKLTFSGLLNALDGIAAQDGRIVVMTTNHPDKLDPALIRPGRADVHVDLPNATAEQAMAIFKRFRPNCITSEQERFASEVTGMSMAKIQELLLGSRNGATIKMHVAA